MSEPLLCESYRFSESSSKSKQSKSTNSRVLSFAEQAKVASVRRGSSYARLPYTYTFPKRKCKCTVTPSLLLRSRSNCRNGKTFADLELRSGSAKVYGVKSLSKKGVLSAKRKCVLPIAPKGG